jgi:glycine cleavage system H protein
MERHFPEGLRYTKDHEWCRLDGDIATIGITWHAQDALGDIVFTELPKVGESVSSGEPFGVVESVKAVSDLFSPVSGKVTERNDSVLESPEGLNEDCYDDGWLIRVEVSDTAELDGLMTAAQYTKFLDDAEE